MHTNENDDRNRVVETASATTSPDNASSGPTAYVITAITLGLLVIISLASAGCVSVAMGMLASELENGNYGSAAQSYGAPYTNFDMDDMDNMDFDQWLEQYYDQTQGTSGGQGSGTADVADVLDFSIAPYTCTLDSEVSANSYAGTPAEVRDFVRDLCAKDTEASKKVVDLLNKAALNDKERTDCIRQAIAACDDAKGQMDSVTVPSVSKDEDGSVKDQLGSAATLTAKRWDLMRQELELLNTTGEVDTNKLWDADEKVVETTETAAETLMEAMATAADL